MPRKRSGGSGSTKAPTGQAARYKGQKATQAKKTGTVLAGKGYGISTAPRSEVARTFGPSSPPSTKPTGSSKPSPRYGYASRRARGVGPTSWTGPSASTGGTSATGGHKGGGSEGPNKSKGASASKPSTVTKQSKAIGRKYAAAVKAVQEAGAMKGKKTSAEERKKILAARAKLRKMREKLTDNKGVKYGSTFKTKKGKVGGRGIYKALTGKSASTLKKPAKPNKNK